MGFPDLDAFGQEKVPRHELDGIGPSGARVARLKTIDSATAQEAIS
jgi:hypothetical protein